VTKVKLALPVPPKLAAMALTLSLLMTLPILV
jgi:hypothetical protein